ncbi:class I SAM-dependent methyltransferase [Thalassobacillus pellis]|uniref:class I SAM-dependent methyltransferase n=1 Tax=Thalassobacillus pellis TaxID=748008 RepID=UPI001961FE19|nr:class I SAM-dependent methyltransferase [Thalassobacillus pellis]MBM7554956.1 site-specific DNA-methyltransferase (adenine-specific) [Thalassobacillus pellis]
MQQKNVEELYEWIDEAATTIEYQENATYLEAVADAMDILFHRTPFEDMSDLLKQQLEKHLKEVSIEKYEKEEIRKATQLAILKGMKGATQQQHLITPDSVAMFMGYLTQRLFPGNEALALFDPACGTANLLTAVMNQLDREVKSYGSDVDETLMKLALANANLQKNEIEFFHQDSLRPFLMEPVDFILSDLPVGYYPDDIQAERFTLKAEEGHSYSHHLFIEQGLNYVKDGGFLMFIVPNFLFESDQSSQLNTYLREKAHIFGMLQLPESFFKEEKHGKSILILQKKGKQTNAPKEALLAKLPSFKNHHAMADIIGQIDQWFTKNHPS